MKINNWSVVKTPIGVSLKHTEGKRLSSLEICIAMIDGKVHISTHQDGVDEPITQALHNTNRIPNVRKPTEAEWVKWGRQIEKAKQKGCK